MSKDAQDIFDALVRTMPARWEGTSIVVSDSVIIEKPYRVENCRAVAPGQGGGEAALGWVRKVVSFLFSFFSVALCLCVSVFIRMHVCTRLSESGG